MCIRDRVGAAINGLRAGWGKFSAMLAGGDDLERVTRRMEAFTGGASSAAEAARDVVDFADTPVSYTHLSFEKAPEG